MTTTTPAQELVELHKQRLHAQRGRVIWWRARPRRRLVLVVRDAAAPVELRPRDLLRWVGPVRALEVATWAGADPVFLRPLVRALAPPRPRRAPSVPAQAEPRPVPSRPVGAPVVQRRMWCPVCRRVWQCLIPAARAGRSPVRSVCAVCVAAGVISKRP